MGAVVLGDSRLVYIDSNIVIYTLDQVEPYLSQLDPFWKAQAAGHITAISSLLTLLESLVKPLREADTIGERMYRRMLTSRPGFQIHDVSKEVLEQAAALRALHPALRTPDAIHAASAVLARCDTLITNDDVFERVEGFRTIVLHKIP